MTARHWSRPVILIFCSFVFVIDFELNFIRTHLGSYIWTAHDRWQAFVIWIRLQNNILKEAWHVYYLHIGELRPEL